MSDNAYQSSSTGHNTKRHPHPEDFIDTRALPLHGDGAGHGFGKVGKEYACYKGNAHGLIGCCCNHNKHIDYQGFGNTVQCNAEPDSKRSTAPVLLCLSYKLGYVFFNAYIVNYNLIRYIRIIYRAFSHFNTYTCQRISRTCHFESVFKCFHL